MRPRLLLLTIVFWVGPLCADPVTAVPTPAALDEEGGQLAIAIELVYDEQLGAMGLQLTLPEGWSYRGVEGEHVPQFAPSAGTTESVECAWLHPPTGGAKFTLQLVYPAGAKQEQLSGFMELRRDGEGRRLPLVIPFES